MCLFLLLAAASARTEVTDESRIRKPHAVGISPLFSHYQFKDKALLPVRFADAGFLGRLFYEYHGASLRHRVSLDAGVYLYGPSSHLDPAPLSLAVHPELLYRLMANVIHPNRGRGIAETGVNAYLGGQILFGSYLNYLALWDDSHPYWITMYELGPALGIQWRLKNRHIIDMQLSFPLLAAVSRPETPIDHKVSDVYEPVKLLHSNMRLTSLHRHGDIQFGLYYEFQIFDWLHQRFLYEFRFVYNRMSYSEPLLIIEQHLGTAWLIRFARKGK